MQIFSVLGPANPKALQPAGIHPSMGSGVGWETACILLSSLETRREMLEHNPENPKGCFSLFFLRARLLTFKYYSFFLFLVPLFSTFEIPMHFSGRGEGGIPKKYANKLRKRLQVAPMRAFWQPPTWLGFFLSTYNQ